MDLVDAGYASASTGCFTGRGANGEVLCFLRWALCVVASASLVSRRGGTAPALLLALADTDAGTAVLGAGTATAMAIFSVVYNVMEFVNERLSLSLSLCLSMSFSQCCDQG